jgi:hypothetical protein
VRERIAQARAAAPAAIAVDGLRPTRWSRLDKRLTRAESFLAAGDSRSLPRAATRIGRVCRKLSR